MKSEQHEGKKKKMYYKKKFRQEQFAVDFEVDSWFPTKADTDCLSSWQYYLAHNLYSRHHHCGYDNLSCLGTLS